MKFQTGVVIGALTIVLAAFTAGRAEVDVRISANFSDLNNYGEWVTVPAYGTVWHPYADEGWRPFTYGHWVYSSDGWVWDSDEPFGWIVCHYGNWDYDNNVGWIWLPGYDWSPARVRWYVTDNQIGWAPMFPEGRPGFRRSNMYMSWTFSATRDFTADEIHGHLAFRGRPEHEAPGVKVYSTAPRRQVVARIVGKPVVSIGVDKVRVTTAQRPLVKAVVKVQNRPQMEVPVGPKYKKGVVQNEPMRAAPAAEVGHGEAEKAAPHQEQSDNPRGEMKSPSNPSDDKVQQRPRGDQTRQRDEPRGDDREKKQRSE